MCDVKTRDRIGSVVCEEKETPRPQIGRTYSLKNPRLIGYAVRNRAVTVGLSFYFSGNCDPSVNCISSVCTYLPIQLHSPVNSVGIPSAEFM